MSHTQVNKYFVIGDVIRYVEMNCQYKTSSLMHALRAFYYILTCVQFLSYFEKNSSSVGLNFGLCIYVSVYVCMYVSFYVLGYVTLIRLRLLYCPGK